MTTLCSRLGTEYWGTINPNCLGSSQSPVNLDSDLLVLGNPGGGRIEFYNYEQVNSDSTVLENNGHTVELKVIIIIGGGGIIYSSA